MKMKIITQINKESDMSHHMEKKSFNDKRAEKRAIILETNNKRRLPWVLATMVAILVLGAGILFATQKTERESIVDNSRGGQVSATSITYPVDLFIDGKARHFHHKTDDGITISYFILKSSDGVIRAAFDACDVCWPAGKGYEQSGDVMVCRNCGRQFASVRVNEVKGGCNPAPLERKIEGDKVVLLVKDIVSGKKYFDFSKRG